MAAELIRILAALTLASSAAIAVMICLRITLRRAFGARLAYMAWLIVPAAAGMAFLPRAVADAPVTWILEPVAATAFAPLPGPAFDLPPLLLALWIAGAAASLSFLVWLQRRAMSRLGLSPGNDRLRAAVAGPAVIGVFASRIVLPTDFERRYSKDEQTVILAHEETHLAAGDVRINAALALTSCLFWFNPLIHVAHRLVRIDQELACDAAVMARFPKARRTYAEALLKTQVSSAPLPLGCYWPERSHQRLKERMTMLTLKTPGRGRLLAGVLAVAIVGLGTGYAAWALSPQSPALTNSQSPATAAIEAPRAEPIVAPKGYKQGMLEALGLPANAKLQIGCHSPRMADCTYTTDDGVARPMPPAGQEAMRRLNPAMGEHEAAFQREREGFVPVPQPANAGFGPVAVRAARAPAGLVPAMNAALGLPPQTELSIQCVGPGAAHCGYRANGGPLVDLPQAGAEVLRRLNPQMAEADANGDAWAPVPVGPDGVEIPQRR